MSIWFNDKVMFVAILKQIVTTRVRCTLGSHFLLLRKITYRVTLKIPNEVCEIRNQAPYVNPG